jgi:hypothetical protein
MVFNLDNSKESGSHWVAVYGTTGGVAYYFDSFGEPPTNEILINLKKYFEKIIYNNHCFQSPITNVCGNYCFYFIYIMSRNADFVGFLKSLHKVKNCDLFVKQFTNNILNQ